MQIAHAAFQAQVAQALADRMQSQSCAIITEEIFLLHRLGGAIFGSAVYVGELFCGNVAYVTILKGASWRWPVVGCGIAVTVVSAATALLIKEPPVGRFVYKQKVGALHDRYSRKACPADCAPSQTLRL